MKKITTPFEGTAYTWSLMTYATNEEIQRLLAITKHFAYCLHDKDTDENGNKITPHTHVLATFEQRISLDKITSIIDSQQNTFGECRRQCGDDWIPLNISALYQYLIHYNETDKYHYDESERITDDKKYWSRYEQKDNYETDKNEQFLTDLLSPFRTSYEMDMELAKKYGRDYIRNREKYQQFRFDLITADIYKQQFDRYEKLFEFCNNNDITERTAIDWLESRLNYERK